MTPWQMFILGILGLVGTLTGAYALLRRLGPEISKVQVDTSTAMVAMARENAEQQRKDAADLRARNTALENRLNDYMTKLAEATGELASLRQRVERAEAHASEEVAAVRQENARLLAENTRLLNHNTALVAENTELRRQLPG